MKLNIRSLYRRLAATVIVTTVGLTSSVAWATPPAGVLDMTHANVKAVKELQEKITPDLMSNLGSILGTAIGLDDNDNVALVVYVDQDSPSKADVIRSFPPQIRGIGVKIEVTEKFRAFGKPETKPGPAPIPVPTSHTAKQIPPIQLGTSGGWGFDKANGYCCGGTLGSLVQVENSSGEIVQYILSNYHVFESDIVNGGNNTTAQTGQNIIQPGLIDVNCTASDAQAVATLVKLSALTTDSANNMDCSVAKVIGGQVKADGSILEIGPISKSTVVSTLKQSVKKSGRTTGLTRSTISGFAAIVSIAYENECAGGAAFTKVFTDQIVVSNKGSKFLAGGDSGSLLVEDVSSKPRAIGLLFAGSNTTAIANPIDPVLSFIGTKLGGSCAMVGQ
jgi:hypothetical protein